MQNIPEEVVNAWLDQKRRLDPRKLIPTLVYYEQKEDKVLVSSTLATSYAQGKWWWACHGIVGSFSFDCEIFLFEENYQKLGNISP